MTPARLFGTDGIRAPFGGYPLDQATVTTLGRELAAMLAETSPDATGSGPTRGPLGPEVVLGGDTRFSTPQLCAWLAAGLVAGGARVRFLGVVPTPAVAFVARDTGAAAGVAVSASHNPWRDNGIKLLGGDGFKWATDDEAALEDRLHAAERDAAHCDADAAELLVDDAAVERYIDALAAALAGNPSGDAPLAGLRVALDTANGAAAPFAGPLFERLGADVVLLHAAPDGRNINRDCGSTRPETLQREVVRRGCDFGVAFDGDADRALLVDETGALRDGDTTLYLWAREMARDGRLDPPRIVATSMSNLGLERALARDGIGVERCGVGDRQVVDTLRKEGLVLGGEQSGHIVHLGLSTTGDGMLTALQMAGLIARSGASLSELLAGFERFPQVLENLRVRSKPPLESLPAVREAAAEVERELGDEGRLVLRYSGTEPLARVMIEGPDQATIERLADRVLAAIASELAESGP